ncbi:MAG: CusA/CzcA family heavy metal efflux RND transporter [Candidatus Obscuribacterales bacterium]|nr:CusA/CzcA family heavy metal efflux RND transporter [Candidatus Obscuribacterales bacterium]
MIEKIIKFSIKQRFLVLLLVLFTAVAGLFALPKLAIDAVPDITNVQVQILTSAPALAPLEVERRVTFPVEIAISGLPGVAEVRSVSKFGLSAVTVVFNDDIDTYFARQLVMERLSKVREQIPDSIGIPEMGPITTGLGEIYQYELKAKSGATADVQELRTTQDWLVRRQMLGIPGVAEVNSYGGQKKQYQIHIDPQRLQSYGLTLRDALDAVVRNNENVGGAYIEHAGEQYILRGIGLTKSVAEIENIVVKAGKEGVPVFVRDIADVVDGSEVRQGAVVADGKGETVAGIVMMLKGENSRSVVERVKDRVRQVQKSLPSNVELVPFYDRSTLIDRTIRTVESNLLEGALLVIVVLLVVLGNWRGAVLVASVIPLSMLFAGICMTVFKISGNLMSLGAIDFGLIVDGAVVMVENAVRRLSNVHQDISIEEKRKIIARACLEVGRPVVFAVSIIAIVYLPILSLTGVEGRLFKPMSLTIVFALIGSLLLTLTYVPAMLTLIMTGRRVSEQDSYFVHIAREFYSKALRIAMTFKAQTFTVAVSMLVLSLLTFPMLGSEFIPRLDEGAIAIQMQQLPSISLNQSIANATQAEKILKSFPEVTKVVSKIGRAQVATDPMGVETADIYVGLRERSELGPRFDREALVEKMVRALEKGIPQAVFSFSQPVELRTSELIAGVRSDVAIKIFGDDMDELKSLAEHVSKAVSQIRGATDIKIEQIEGLPQLVITPDRSAIARYGINVEDINNVVQSIVAGKPAGLIYEGEKRFDMVVRLKENIGHDINSIKELLISAPNGARIPLSELASVKVEEGPAQISREGSRRRIVVELNVRGRDLGSFVTDAQKQIEKVKLPEGYYITWGGQFENLKRATDTLLVVVPLALFLIFVLLFMTFGSFRQALLIFTGIPFAVVGGIFALACRGMPCSISAGIGFIALSGVAVLNGVVLVSYINKLTQRMETEVAVRKGALTRLRPVLMTAMVASVGFVPMAFSTSAGAEVQRPLATVVIGGLITSSILTLLLLPDLYLWFENAALRMTRKQPRQRALIDVSKLPTSKID